MSEKPRSSAEPPRPTISHDEAIRHPELRKQYREERVALIKSGEPVWMVQGLGLAGEMETDITALEYYQGGGKRGYIEGNDLDGYHIYVPEIEEGTGPHHLNTDPIMLQSEAQKTLEDYIKDTDLPNNT